MVETTDRWLRAQAWPLWLEHGVDWDRGGFHEHLCPSTLRCDAPFRRLRVAARQVYAFSHAARASLPKAHDAVELGLRSIRTDFSLSGGRYATRCDVQGTVIDARVDLYDQAFVLLALASAHALRPCHRLRHEAHALVRFLDTSLRHPGGYGFREGVPDRLPRRQNPHMHLLEAFLAAGESFHDDLFFVRAAEMVDLFLDVLFQEAAGALPESFDAAWRPLAESKVFIVEPGHHAEWIWLLSRFVDLTGDRSGRRARCDAAAQALGRFTQRFGAGPLFDTVWSDGRVRSPGRSLWPQAEALKAEACRADRSTDGLLRAYADLGRFLLPEPKGLWREQIGPGREGPNSVARASSLYHLTGAITEASRRLSGGHAPTAAPDRAPPDGGEEIVGHPRDDRAPVP